jgi:hypothetical protein
MDITVLGFTFITSHKTHIAHFILRYTIFRITNNFIITTVAGTDTLAS